MNSFETIRNHSSRVLRQFAGAWLVCLSAAGAHQWLARSHHHAAVVIWSIAVLFGLPGLVRPALIRWLFIAAMVAAFPIGWGISQIVLAVMYYLVITPVALVLRWRCRDRLQLKPGPDRQTCWVERQSSADLRSYFRQY